MRATTFDSVNFVGVPAMACETPAKLRNISEADLVLLLKEVEGFSLAELSEMTGLNSNTLKVRLFRTCQCLIKAAAQLESPGRPAGRVEILQ
jgi:lambda repressor-like predicted transcriptional regulator